MESSEKTVKSAARKRGAQRGNANAAKPAELRRVPLNVRVAPKTAARLAELSRGGLSQGVAIDRAVALLFAEGEKKD